jgi:hypothetical protein
MDLTPFILVIAAVNLGTLAAGTALAIYRTHREGRVEVAPRSRLTDRSAGRQTSVLAGRSD